MKTLLMLAMAGAFAFASPVFAGPACCAAKKEAEKPALCGCCKCEKCECEKCACCECKGECTCPKKA